MMNNIPDAKAEATSHLQEVIKRSGKNINDTIDLLRQQRDMLKQRGLSLPQGALDNLRTLKKHVDNLGTATLNSFTELRSLRALAETTALINSSQTTGEVLNQVMDTVVALTGAERGYIVMKNQHTSELEFTVARGMDQSQLDGSKGLVVSRSIVNRVADTGEPVLTDNASADAQFQGSESIANFSLRSIMAVPLKVRDEVIGVVYCDNRFFAGLFKPADMELLYAFASQAAVAIENARLFESTRLRLQEVSEMRDRMRNIFTSVASGILTTDREGIIIIANSRIADMLDSQDITGKTLPEALPPMGDEFATALQNASVAGLDKLLSIEPELPTKGKRYWNVNVSPLRDDNTGIIQGVTVVIDDTTEERMRASQLAEVSRYLPTKLVESLTNPADIDMRPQEREITALFADVRGFTTFSEKLQPEELMRVINKYLSLASDAIDLYQGIVDKYMGDAVTGLFNTQLNPQKYHAAFAVDAALALVRDLFEQHKIMPESERLYYGIGIHSGPAVLGNVGGKERQEFAALGEATVICKYLQEQAGPAEVIISEETYQLVKNYYECERQTEVKRYKKGYEDVVFYKVIEAKKGVMRPTPFNLELLEDLGDLDLNFDFDLDED
jgi:PAS domain S-box-containing protein